MWMATLTREADSRHECQYRDADGNLEIVGGLENIGDRLKNMPPRPVRGEIRPLSLVINAAIILALSTSRLQQW